MKKTILLILVVAAITNTSYAQQIPGGVITPQSTPPIKVYEKPQIKKQIVLPANPKQTTLPSFESMITTVHWSGQLWWNDASAGYSDGITLMQFAKDKSVTWSKQGVEIVAATPGTYNITQNKITVNFVYAPYTYSLDGSYNATTGEITGNYTLVKDAHPNAPTGYTEGKINGTFKLVKK
jgi:hypothetical protein